MGHGMYVGVRVFWGVVMEGAWVAMVTERSEREGGRGLEREMKITIKEKDGDISKIIKTDGD